MSGTRKDFLNCVTPLLKFPNQKIDIYFTQNEEKYLKDYFRTNISHQEGLFKESYSICFFFYQKSCNYYFIGV